MKGFIIIPSIEKSYKEQDSLKKRGLKEEIEKLRVIYFR
jgi:hypothetical protein